MLMLTFFFDAPCLYQQTIMKEVKKQSLSIREHFQIKHLLTRPFITIISLSSCTHTPAHAHISAERWYTQADSASQSSKNKWQIKFDLSEFSRPPDLSRKQRGELGTPRLFFLYRSFETVSPYHIQCVAFEILEQRCPTMNNFTHVNSMACNALLHSG